MSQSQAQNNAVNIVGETNFPVALRPPPRGSRQPKNHRASRRWGGEGIVSPTCSDFSWTNGSTQQPHSVEYLGRTSVVSSSTNPYINPAPRLEAEERRVTERGQIELSERRVRPSQTTAPVRQRPHATSQQSRSRAVSLDVPFSSRKNINNIFSDTLSKEAALGFHHEGLCYSLPRPAGQPKREIKTIKGKESGERLSNGRSCAWHMISLKIIF